MEYLSKITYAENIKAAEHFLKMANDHKLGQRWNLVATVTFCAFSIEAYLNHVGEKQEGKTWSIWDRKDHPSPREKLDRLMNNNLNYSCEPFSSFGEIFELRDIVAHGRTIVIKKAVRKPENNLKGAMNNLSSGFESRTTLKKVKNLFDSTKAIISAINSKTVNASNHELWSIGSGSLRTS